MFNLIHAKSEQFLFNHHLWATVGQLVILEIIIHLSPYLTTPQFLWFHGLVIGYLGIEYFIQYAILPPLNSKILRDELRELGGRYNLIKRRFTLFLINYLSIAILLHIIPYYYIQQFLALAFITGSLAIYANAYNNQFQFRILYGLELYLLLISITTVYAIFYTFSTQISIFFVPFIFVIISYFAFEYLLSKRVYRIYSTACTICEFRKHRHRYLIAYSLICTFFFTGLWYFKINILLAGLILSTSLHIMRGFTCGNFKKTLSKEIKQSYFFILAILIIIAFSSITPDHFGKVPVTENNSINTNP